MCLCGEVEGRIRAEKQKWRERGQGQCGSICQMYHCTSRLCCLQRWGSCISSKMVLLWDTISPTGSHWVLQPHSRVSPAMMDNTRQPYWCLCGFLSQHLFEHFWTFAFVFLLVYYDFLFYVFMGPCVCFLCFPSCIFLLFFVCCLTVCFLKGERNKGHEVR